MNFLFLLRTIFLVLLFSQYARNVKFPLPIYKSKKGWTAYRLQLFKMFPVSSSSPHPQHSMPFFTCKMLMFACKVKERYRETLLHLCDDDIEGLDPHSLKV